ncbi:type-III secretion protein [Yersinia pseudotuberculosis]|nr:type-III secretion protein [Yersinia pseudotuberculosis]CNJ39917.1 type-III secretion protein [Yersinia pseudotuberculosis]VEE73931.1 type-III secretion protein [Yersinia pseudotuberculosis]
MQGNNMTTVFKLRLLNGDLNGRELILPEGEFTLGSRGVMFCCLYLTAI